MQHVRFTPMVLSGAFSLALLTGCPNAGTQPPVIAASGEPTSAPSAAPSTPATSASTDPGQGGATAAPSMTPSSSPLSATTIRGKVYDENDAAVSGAKVSVKSLNPSNPFESTVDVVAGSYVVNDVPAGVQLQIVATKDKWTSRTRVETLLPLTSAQANIVNFGGTDNADAEGGAYFLSKYPEVASASGTYDGSKLTYVIKLSEALDEDNRRRFEDALTIQGNPDASGLISIRRNSAFMVDRVLPKATWDAAGTTLTFEFGVPLRASQNDKTKYTLTLVRGADGTDIKDTDNNILGMGLMSGEQYREAFKLGSPVAAAAGSTAAQRWEAAHTGSASFDVEKDDTAPKLESVKAAGINDNYRFELTFNEPMVAYPEASAFAAATTVLSNYSFVFSKTAVTDVDMSVALGTPVSDAATGLAAMNAKSRFNFAAGTVTFDPSNPRTVFVTVARTLVPTEAKYFKVRVENAADPAGNTISTSGKVEADDTADNIKFGSLL